MTDLDVALDACLAGLQDGSLTLDLCLARYPEHAARLGPMLRAAARQPSVALPSPAFKARLRAQLVEGGSTRAAPVLSKRLVLRPAAVVTALSLLLTTTGTALAQAALPGSILYPWKITSERAWRSVAADSVSVDLALARRRVDEWIAVAPDSALGESTYAEYRKVLERVLAADTDENHARIQAELDDQERLLAAAGLTPPPFDDLPATREPLAPVTPVTATPAASPPISVTVTAEPLSTLVPTESANTDGVEGSFSPPMAPTPVVPTP